MLQLHPKDAKMSTSQAECQAATGRLFISVETLQTVSTEDDAQRFADDHAHDKVVCLFLQP